MSTILVTGGTAGTAGTAATAGTGNLGGPVGVVTRPGAAGRAPAAGG
ncbi:hypothetical protein [Streptomyces roseus]|nr:hypothetical protein [Streptomyces roseus]